MGGMCWEQGSSEMGAAAHAEGMVGRSMRFTHTVLKVLS